MLVRTRRCRHAGMALLEIVIAMTILVIAALSIVAWVTQASDTVFRTDLASAEAASASDYLERIALWTREDLDRHLGSRKQGPWTVTVERPTLALYIVTIRDRADSRTILRTTLYRPEVPRVIA